MIVLDSSLLVAYHNDRDVHHAAAAALVEDILVGRWGRALLLEYVYLEVVTVLVARRGLATALAVGSVLLQAREIDFVPCSDFFLDTVETFRTQGRGTLSFTDAAIVAVARRSPPGHIATFDTDFRDVDGVIVVPSAGAGVVPPAVPDIGGPWALGVEAAEKARKATACPPRPQPANRPPAAPRSCLSPVEPNARK